MIMTLDSWNDWKTHYQNVLALPDWQVRRARLEVLDQALVDALWQEGRLLARPKVVVEFEEGAPYGHSRAGARAENPGIIRLRSDQFGRVASGTGCAATGPRDPASDISHRWAVLFHEAAHFTFDQLSARDLTSALPPLVPSALAKGLGDHLWAPFLNNPERVRLNETFADVWSSATLLGWGGLAAEEEVERLRATRGAGREVSEQNWRNGQPELAHGGVHVGDQAIERVARAPAWDQLAGRQFLERSLAHALGGTLDRWRTQGDQALAAIEESWIHMDTGRLRVATVHARQHHDPALLDRWIEAHPDHPLIHLAQELRWTAPLPSSSDTAAWGARWGALRPSDLDVVSQSLVDLTGELKALCAQSSVRRRPRLS